MRAANRRRRKSRIARVRSAVSDDTQPSSVRASMRARPASVMRMRASVSSCSSRPSLRSRSICTSGPRVRPCTTRVARITVYVRKITSSRSGKGPPPSIVSGIASAAARATAPRMELHPMTSVMRQGGAPSSS